MSIVLDIPNNIHKTLHVTPARAEARFKLELAVALYAQSALGLGKATELAGLSRLDNQ